MMTRNTEKRVEVACPVRDKEVREQINHYLKIMLEDNIKARVLQRDGSYRKRSSPSHLLILRQCLWKKLCRRQEKSRRRKKKSCSTNQESVSEVMVLPPGIKDSKYKELE